MQLDDSAAGNSDAAKRGYLQVRVQMECPCNDALEEDDGYAASLRSEESSLWRVPVCCQVIK